MSMAGNRPKILMVAFACNPLGGGEHWLGWGWAEEASKFCDVTVLAWDRFSKNIQERATETGVRPVLVGVPGWVNRVGDSSTMGRWVRQLIWHRRAGRIARELHSREKFQLVHQTTFHTFRIPFLARDWNIPKVWGPIAGGETCPPGFENWLGGLKYQESFRGTMNRFALRSAKVQQSLKAVDSIFVSNRTTLDFLPPNFRSKCSIVPPNTVRRDIPPAPVRSLKQTGPLNLLFVGNCVATRCMPLVFEAIKRVPKLPCVLTVVGGGAALEGWKKLVSTNNLTDKVRFTGKIPFSEVAARYDKADAFVFPALRDSGGSGLLEAMSAALPVVCCDWGGPAEMLDTGSGLKISVKNPEAAISGFVEAIEKLHQNPGWGLAMGKAAAERARKNFSWEKKREQLQVTYGRLLGLSL